MISLMTHDLIEPVQYNTILVPQLVINQVFFIILSITKSYIWSVNGCCISLFTYRGQDLFCETIYSQFSIARFGQFLN